METLTEEKSTHKVVTFPFPPMEKHPNADMLSLITIPDSAYTYVARTEDWQNRIGALCAWIPPDNLVNVAHPKFSFLATEAKYNKDSTKNKNGQWARIKAKRIRGISSFGLCVPLDETETVESLGVVHFDPEIISAGSGKQDTYEVPGPNIPKYDVDSILKYSKYFVDGELVYILEKIDGENSKFTMSNNVVYCGSRSMWKAEMTSPPNITVESLIDKGVPQDKAREIYTSKVVNFKAARNSWWQLYYDYPGIKSLLEAFPEHTLFGENYGGVGGMNYNVPSGKRAFVAFDLLKPNGVWMDYDEFLPLMEKFNIPTPPLLYKGPYSLDKVKELSEGETTTGANHIREGCVVRPVKERYVPRVGRIVFKCVNIDWLSR